MTRTKKLLLLLAIIFFLLIGSWGVVFASVPSMVKLLPEDGSYIAQEKPAISAKWQALPGISLQEARVFLDGVEITPEVNFNDSSFSYQPSENLAQGEHLFEAELTLRIVVPRSISLKGRFTVDTQPPPLALAENVSFVVTPTDEAEVQGRTEPGAIIKAALNEQDLPDIPAGNDGIFNVSLSNLQKKNQLRLAAQDRVGNLRSVVIPVIKDEVDPAIKSMTPAEREVIRVPSPRVAVSFLEEDSGLKSIKLLIDGTEAVSKYEEQSLDIAYLGALLADGNHTARVEATDYAGRTIFKEWNFTVDSRRIVINRGERRLYFYQNGALQRVYPVAVGMPAYPTPVGKWRIVRKEVNPTWYNPGSDWAKDMPKVIPPGPGNPLGTRALALSAPGILIHGTYDTASVGQAASHGCVRMFIRDIEGFFPMVSVGTPVDVVN